MTTDSVASLLPGRDREAEFDRKLDQLFGPATPETIALIKASIILHKQHAGGAR